MDVRDAVEADADLMAAIADAPTDVMRNLVHDRTVRVAEVEQGETPDVAEFDPDAEREPAPDADDDDDHQLVGFVSFDASDSVFYVTQIEGTPDAVERLLAEPVGFAREEEMRVEVLLPEDEENTRETVEAVGFEAAGDGPRFDGVPTTRFQMEP